MNRRVITAENQDSLSQLASVIMTDITLKAIEARGRAVILVSGGTSVRRTYEIYGSSMAIDWSKVYVFWGDDRFVEPESAYSNYGLVKDSLLVNARGLPASNIFPISYDAPNPSLCAALYGQTIRRFYELEANDWPVFDLAQNGLGADGHTASLFPHTHAVHVDDKIAVTNHAGLSPWVDRITLTFPVFNHARVVLFITAGKSKAAILQTVLEGAPTVDDMPAAHINPPDGQVIWAVDAAAASDLTITTESEYLC